MTIEKVVITPQEALRMLEKNNSNRTLRLSTVDFYARQMSKGEWQLNGEAIKFSSSGELKDGQHRLTACAVSGVPLETYVIYDDDCTIFDVGVKRSVSDLLKFRNSETNVSNNWVVAAARIHLIALNGSNSYLGNRRASTYNPTTSQIIAYLEENEDLFSSSLNTVQQGKHNGIARKSACILACYYALKSGVETDVLKKFFEIVNTGYCEDKSQFAAVMIRNNLINKRFSSGLAETTRQTCMAINDFIKGKERSSVYDITKKVPFMDSIIEIERNFNV